MILLCLKTAFSSFSPKICPNCLLFYQNLHILWYPSFRTFSFHDSLLQKYCIFGVSNIFTTLQLGNMKQRKGCILLRYFSILQRYRTADNYKGESTSTRQRLQNIATFQRTVTIVSFNHMTTDMKSVVTVSTVERGFIRVKGW